MARRKTWLVLACVLGVAGSSVCGAEGQAAGEAAPRSALQADWMHQDGVKNPAACFTAKTGAAVEIELVGRALKDLGPAAGPYRQTLERLTAAGVAGGDEQWRTLYTGICEHRRRLRLERLAGLYPQVVFTKHYDIGGSHYAYTEGQSDAQAERHFRPGAALCVLQIGKDAVTARTLIEDPNGVIRDPDVSYDGKRILFAWKKSDREDDYHLYEMDAATRQVRQLTAGLGFADYEGVYLPNGDILFNSTRCVQTVDCWWTEVSNLYTCDKDGKYLRRLSFDQVHTNYPQVLDDGRIIYTRWDYNDRGQLYPQPLFQMNPGGTAQTEFYGNNSWFPTTIMHARGIPGTGKLVAILSGHHSHQRGKLALVDVSRGQQEASGVQLISPVRETRAVRIDAYGQDGEQFQYPYPLSETEYFVTYAPDSGGNRQYKQPFGIYWMDIDGRRELLAWDAKTSCSQPVPLAARPVPHLRPSVVDYRKDTGIFYVKDVYVGPGLSGVPRGTVKSLRVVALEFRAAGIGSNGNSGPAGGALVSTPVSCRNGTWDVKVVLGTTPVYADGSAMFTVPARTPLYFQLLDEKNHVVQTMRSWSTLQPGEVFSCVGCHEPKSVTAAPTDSPAIALARGPQRLEPFYGAPRGFSFPKEIQPILDKHCVRCHNDRARPIASAAPPAKTPAEAPPLVLRSEEASLLRRVAGAPAETKKAFSLLDERTVDKGAKRLWSDSYLALTQDGKPNRLVNWLNVQSIPPMLPPYFAGAAKSDLMTLLEQGHYNVKLDRQELGQIACWIDLLVPFCGDYVEANAWTDAEKEKYARFQAKRDRMAAVERANIAALIAAQTGRLITTASQETPAPAAYRNVALNPSDVQGDAKGYPHASASSEYRNTPCFAALCAIDGKTDNKGHGPKFPSWGPDRRTDLWWKVEFGRPVEVDKVVLYIRADFPHDRHWHSATIEFSDGSREKVRIQKTAEPQTFAFTKRTVTWLKFTDLVQEEPLGWCGFTEVEVWGRGAGPAASLARGLVDRP